MTFDNLLAGPPPTLLPDRADSRAALETGAAPDQVAAADPEFSLAWAELADDAYDRGAVIESYAYARTGYHRGLDAAAPRRVEGPRPGAVGARPQPRVPALPPRAGAGRAGHRRDG